jgi:hypothetical protein
VCGGSEIVLGPPEKKGVRIGEDDIFLGPSKRILCIYLADAFLVIPIWYKGKCI